LVKTLARIVGAEFGRIQFTPDLMPSDITGTNVFNVSNSTFSLRRGAIFTDILLADEINRTPPKTQAALLEAMEERQVTIDGELHQLSPLFTVLATENPIEYEGTYPLPEAQLDRFLLKILIDYPSAEDEAHIVANWDEGFNARRLELIDIVPLADANAVSQCRAEIRRARMEPGVRAYVVQIVRRTREHPAIAYGASPRASVAMLLCAKALAAMRGRKFATPDDVRDIARPVLRHRLRLRAEAELDGATPESVITDILQTVEVPR
jgi:MoxR-like ATPase